MLLIKGMIKVAVSVIIIGAIVCGIGFFVGDFSFADIRKSFLETMISLSSKKTLNPTLIKSI